MDRKKIVGLIALGVAGYEIKQYVDFNRQLSFTVSNFNLRKGSNHLIVEYSLKIINSTNVAMPISKVSGVISYGGKRVANFSTNKNEVIQPNKTTSMNMVSHITPSEGLAALGVAMTKVSKFDVRYSVTAKPIFFKFLPVPLVVRSSFSYDFAPYIDVVRKIIDIFANLRK